MAVHALYYIAQGDQYVDEAIQSAVSVIEHMGSDFFDMFLFTNTERNVFYQTIKTSPRETEYFYKDHTRWMRDATRYIYKNFNYTSITYMDTDTFACAPFGEVYELLDAFDFLGVHAPGRFTTRTRLGIPDAFPEFNLGFNPMNPTFAQRLFSDAFEMWDDEVYGNNDQGAVRDVLWSYANSSEYFAPNFYVLPPEYNCRFNFPFFASRTVKILHGRAPDIRAVARKVNEDKGMRSWTNIVNSL